MSKRNYIIITGASKGLGEGIAKALLTDDNTLISISRTKSKDLISIAKKNKSELHFIQYDLINVFDISELMERVFEKISNNINRLILVNNAGVIKPIGPVEECNSEQIHNHMAINLIAPMLITKEFISKSKAINSVKRVLNISSGAAINPYFGWSCYCTGKAGLDMFTKCIALEQERNEYPTEIMSLAPGIIETSMQEIIRSTSAEKFPLKNKFVELKEKGQLIDPEISGKKIADILLGNDFQNGGFLDIRDK